METHQEPSSSQTAAAGNSENRFWSPPEKNLPKQTQLRTQSFGTVTGKKLICNTRSDQLGLYRTSVDMESPANSTSALRASGNSNSGNNNSNTDNQRRLSLGIGRRQRAITIDNNELVGAIKPRTIEKKSGQECKSTSGRSTLGALKVGTRDKGESGIVRAIGLRISSGRSTSMNVHDRQQTSDNKSSNIRAPSRPSNLNIKNMKQQQQQQRTNNRFVATNFSSSSSSSSQSSSPSSLSLSSSTSSTSSDDMDDVTTIENSKDKRDKLRSRRKYTPYTYKDADGVLITDLDSISLIYTSSESSSDSDDSDVEASMSNLRVSAQNLSPKSIKTDSTIKSEQMMTEGRQQNVVKRSQYAWCPPNLNKSQVKLFYSKFPTEKVPIIGTTGDQYRDIQIENQLPPQDMSIDYCRFVDTEDERVAYNDFIVARATQALDVGQAVRLVDGANFRSPPNNGTIRDDSSTLVINGSVKCRRCLGRIDTNDLAVVAPKLLASSGVTLNPTMIKADTSSSSSSLDLVRRLSNSSSQLPHTMGIFHPQCFTCYKCKELLVDLIYCFKDNRVYCVRHYGDLQRPRCGTCQELIFSEEYSKAMGDDFHVGHFMCRHCNKNLAGQRYVLKDEQSYCVTCYETKFANTCEDCRKLIGIDSRDLAYKDKHWHDTCFVCNRCQASLVDKPFGTKAEHIYCADCYDNSFATRCFACNNPFRAGSKKMEYRGRQWHDSCFCCCVCKNTIGSNSFIPKEDSIFCIKCYEDKYATKCTKCKLVIASGGVTFRNEPWHRECFQCCHCAKSLAGQRFTTHDSDKQEAMQHNKTGQAHNAYCIDCYSKLFAKKCFSCSEAITGVGGTRFVTFEDRNWHNDCFLCTDCRQSLVGKGFITDGPEAILCGECARAKLR